MSFVVLINGAPSIFFRATHGLRQECSLSPFLFLIVAKALSKMLTEARQTRAISGMKILDRVSISHLLFVDNVLCFAQGTQRDLSALKGMLDLFCKATGMQTNMDKSCLLSHNLPDQVVKYILNLLPFPQKESKCGLKNSGFTSSRTTIVLKTSSSWSKR
jgi:hypothetical protein